MKKIPLIIFLIWIVSFAGATTDTTHVEVILDASNSMNEVINGEKKMDTAKKVLSNLVQQWEDESAGMIKVGLRIYGNYFDPYKSKEIACQDTTLEVPIGENTATAIKSKIYSVEAKGYTPIAYTLNEARADFTIGNQNTVVLVSDGKESCGGDPCQVAKAFKKDGIDLTIHVVGFAVDDETKQQLKCIADATEGNYYTAENAEDLQLVAQQVKQLVSEKIEQPKQTVKKIKIAGPGKITFHKPEELESLSLSRINIHKAGTDEIVVGMWKDFYKPKVLSSGSYDVWIEYKGSQGVVQYANNIEVAPKKETMMALNTGAIFSITDEDTLKGIDRIHIHSLPDDKELVSTWDQEYMTSPKILPPGKYRIYFTYKGSRDKTMVIEELEIPNNQLVEIEI
ncbi:MAG: VWA domain-containing protein [Chlamydiota bacterium]|nr:VWA domain-containing protein [Chlamydiota bacterium]